MPRYYRKTASPTAARAKYSPSRFGYGYGGYGLGGVTGQATQPQPKPKVPPNKQYRPKGKGRARYNPPTQQQQPTQLTRWSSAIKSPFEGVRGKTTPQLFGFSDEPTHNAKSWLNKVTGDIGKWFGDWTWDADAWERFRTGELGKRATWKALGEAVDSPMEKRQRADLSQYNAARNATGTTGTTFSGHKEAQYPIGDPRRYGMETDQYGRPINDIDPALYERIMSSKPQDNSGAFEQHNFYQGEDFINYLMNEGIVPHWGNVQSPSGKWIDYLLTKMGITSYGVNPFAKPAPQQQAPPPSGGGGYGGGYGGGGGGGYTPPKPKQYGDQKAYQGRNYPQWLQEMLVWNI